MHAKRRFFNSRPANEFVLCLRCARWGSHSPDRDCSHVERVDLSEAASPDVDYFETLAERIAKGREIITSEMTALRNDAKRLVNQGKARERDITAPPSSGVVRLIRHVETIPRHGDKVRLRVRIATDPANQN
jgi:hypothetical protein